MILDINIETGSRTASSIANAEFIHCDVANKTAIDTSVESIIGRHGQIDVCVNNAGILRDETFHKGSEANWDLVIKVHLKGTYCCTKPVFEWMRANGGGTIVNTSSTSGLLGNFGQSNYGAAKAGFTAFLSGLRNRLAGQGVHVVTVKPGFVATRMTENMDLPEKLTAAPAEVGQAVLKAVEKRQDVIYVRAVWRMIMGIIRLIPERVFKKLKI